MEEGSPWPKAVCHAKAACHVTGSSFVIECLGMHPYNGGPIAARGVGHVKRNHVNVLLCGPCNQTTGTCSHIFFKRRPWSR